MTDPLSERLEKELRPAVRNYCGSEDCRPLLKLMIEAVLPILRDEIAAVRERTLEAAFKAQCWMCRQDAYIFFDEKTLHFHHKDGSVCGADRIRVTVAALKTPQPEVSK